jgi:hypothetical protein
MRPSDLTKALRRDDLTIFGNYYLDELACVEDHIPYSSPVSERVLLIDSDACGVVQAIEVMDDYTPDQGATFVYVPLMFGPVRELPRPTDLVRALIAQHGDVTLEELPCVRCRVLTLEPFLELVGEWPIGKVCSGCADEIRADDLDPVDPGGCDECGNPLGCNACNGVSRAGGF